MNINTINKTVVDENEAIVFLLPGKVSDSLINIKNPTATKCLSDFNCFIRLYQQFRKLIL